MIIVDNLSENFKLQPDNGIFIKPWYDDHEDTALLELTPLLVGKKYDIIIANINRNILLNDMQQYLDCLNENGILFLSGFYTEDIPFISESCTSKGLSYVKQFERNNWVALKFEK